MKRIKTTRRLLQRKEDAIIVGIRNMKQINARTSTKDQNVLNVTNLYIKLLHVKAATTHMEIQI